MMSNKILITSLAETVINKFLLFVVVHTGPEVREKKKMIFDTGDASTSLEQGKPPFVLQYIQETSMKI